MYELIEHRRLDANAASITFSSIPQNYSDLVIMVSTRINEVNATGEAIYITINGSTANFTNRYLQGDGQQPASSTLTRYVATQPALLSTANTFGNGCIYIPNYAGNTAKAISSDSVSENNGTTAFQALNANLWNVTDPITSVTLVAGTGDAFVANSSATLYGINRTSGIGRAPLAMGGYMSYSNGYWVHTFPSSGSFIPFTNMEVEYLVVGGGGGGGSSVYGAGGGAGGYRSSVVGELSGRNSVAESRLSLTANTNYTVTIGAGGAANTNGSNSVFGSITSTGGGAGGREASTNGNAGGSGGGESLGFAIVGAGTANQGFDGGKGNAPQINQGSGGGGGGAGSVGGNSSGFIAGNGGSGLASSITGSTIFRAGGGGGSGYFSGWTQGVGRDGGGNAASGTANAGTVNTGGGGGGSGIGTGGTGGSGIVVVRYRA
jgi:hypothetical protein